jgi:hypothetical protein
MCLNQLARPARNPMSSASEPTRVIGRCGNGLNDDRSRDSRRCRHDPIKYLTP